MNYYFNYDCISVLEDMTNSLQSLSVTGLCNAEHPQKVFYNCFSFLFKLLFIIILLKNIIKKYFKPK